MCVVLMCSVVRILGLKELVTTNTQTITLRIDPKFGLSILDQISKI